MLLPKSYAKFHGIIGALKFQFELDKVYVGLFTPVDLCMSDVCSLLVQFCPPDWSLNKTALDHMHKLSDDCPKIHQIGITSDHLQFYCLVRKVFMLRSWKESLLVSSHHSISLSKHGVFFGNECF